MKRFTSAAAKADRRSCSGRRIQDDHRVAAELEHVAAEPEDDVDQPA